MRSWNVFKKYLLFMLSIKKIPSIAGRLMKISVQNSKHNKYIRNIIPDFLVYCFQ